MLSEYFVLEFFIKTIWGPGTTSVITSDCLYVCLSALRVLDWIKMHPIMLCQRSVFFFRMCPAGPWGKL